MLKKGTTPEEFRAYEKARHAAWYKRTKAKRLAYHLEWRKRNPRLAAEASKRWAASAGSKAALDRWRKSPKGKAWVEKNREKFNAGHRAARKLNPLPARIRCQERAARKRAAGGRYTVKDVEAMYASQCGLCVYCSADLSEKFDIDHKTPLVRGGSNDPSNLQLLCPTCNRTKSKKTHEEFLEWRRERAA